MFASNGQAVAVPTISIGVVHGQRESCTAKNTRTIVEKSRLVEIARIGIGASSAGAVVATTDATIVICQAGPIFKNDIWVVIARRRIRASSTSAVVARAHPTVVNGSA